MRKSKGDGVIVKQIALTPRLDRQQGYDEVREAVDQRWGQLLMALGYQPVILSHSLSMDFLGDLGIDGVLLTGGNDLAVVSDCDLSAQRDLFEKQLLQYAIARQLPVLGVCRGMQLIAHYFGCDLEPIHEHVGTTHQLDVLPASRFFHELKRQPAVNSYHNYRVSNLSADLTVSARCAEDHSIEALEHPDYPLFGQMWHPERNFPTESADELLIRKVFG